LTLLNGESIEGMIESIEFEEFSFRTADEVKTLNFDQINKIEFGQSAERPANPASQVQLIDGSELQAVSFGIKSNQLTIQLHAGTTLSVSSRNVNAIRFKSYEDELELSKQWRKLLADDSRQGDAIVVNRDGELDTVEGIVGELADEKLEFSIEDRTARVPLERMDAILFYHASGREFGSPICDVTLIDQSIIHLKSIQWKDSKLIGQAVCGAKFEIPRPALSRLNFALGNEVLLSSLQPTTNDWQPLMTSSAIVNKLRRMKLARTNQSFSGKPLSLKFLPESGANYSGKTRQFENGFAMQGGGKLAFALNGQYEKLTGFVGFDPEANENGNVKFTILLDGKTVLDKQMLHRKMQNPIELDLVVKDAARVVFQVEYSDGRSTGDQIHLVDLRVSQ